MHEAVVAEHPNLTEHDVYACGALIVVRSAHEAFTTACGLKETVFYPDAFLSATDLKMK